MTRRGKKASPTAFLPLSPARFHVLLALAGGEKHGYAIIKEVSRLSCGKSKINVSTLYAVIQSLEAEGLIAESDERPDPALDDERRRYYRLTGLGRDVARAEAERLEDIVTVARARKLTKATQRARS